MLSCKTPQKQRVFKHEFLSQIGFELKLIHKLLVKHAGSLRTWSKWAHTLFSFYLSFTTIVNIELIGQVSMSFQAKQDLTWHEFLAAQVQFLAVNYHLDI